MSRNPVSRVTKAIAMSAQRAWTQPWDALLGFLGLLLRFFVAFGVCFWLFHILAVTYVCFGPASSQRFLTDLSVCLLLITLLSTVPMFPVWPLEQFIISGVAALPIAIAWGRIYRRRCPPVREWF